MTINAQPKASMHVLNTPVDPLVSQGARRACKDAPVLSWICATFVAKAKTTGRAVTAGCKLIQAAD